jgi:TM2 domain-containing membrane protein YozV
MLKKPKVFRALACLGFVGIGGMEYFYLGQPTRGTVYVLTIGCAWGGTIHSLVKAPSIVADDARVREREGSGPRMSTDKQRAIILSLAGELGSVQAQAALGPAFTLGGTYPWAPPERLANAVGRLTFSAASLGIESLLARKDYGAPRGTV